MTPVQRVLELPANPLNRSLGTLMKIQELPANVEIPQVRKENFMTKSTRNFSKLILGATVRVVAILLVLVGYATTATLAQPRAYVANFNDNTVSVIDSATNTVVAAVPVEGVGNIAVTPDGAFAYLTTAHNTVSVLDTATNTVVATMPVGPAPSTIAITPNGDFAYVTNFGIATGTL